MPSTDTAIVAERADTLALLYQGILTGIVRIQAGRQSLADVETFRRRMKAALQDVAKEATAAGYDLTEIRDAEFAVVAFLDEAILSSKEPKAEEWRKRPLNIELFGQAIAGDVFFDKLADIERRRDSLHLADLLEVYLLCLLLGFEGRFAPPLKSEAHRIIERLRGRIESTRSITYRISPVLDLAPERPRVSGGRPWLLWVAGTLAAAILLFLFYKLQLSWTVDHIDSGVLDLR
jgi:type VI secretion system protein ImpK